MPRIRYQDFNFRKSSLLIIERANQIINEYLKMGFDLTLRQLYYQFVSRDWLANTQKNYKSLGSIINDARLGGLIDWERIEDRTRSLERISTWDNPAELVSICAETFKVDFWESQPYRVEVWIEKDALAGVFERVCQELRIPYLSCRGYTSQSEMWRASRRLNSYRQQGKIPCIFHFGDHDPSGVDMSRDIQERLEMFTGRSLKFERLALTIEQVEEYQPPPNPTKATDTRSDKYGMDECWELDALDPTVLSALVRDNVDKLIDQEKWQESINEEAEHKRLLQVVSDQWEDLTSGL